MRANLAILSLVPLLATSVSALTLPFRNIKNVARGEQVLAEAEARAALPPVERWSPKKRVVRRQRNRNRTSSCQPSYTSNSTLPSSTDWSAPTSTDWSAPTDSSSQASSTTTSDNATPTDGGDYAHVGESPWKLWKRIEGRDFFAENHWQFWNYDDPTHGEVTYVDRSRAFAAGLAEIDGQGNAIMRVETTPKTGKRESIRLHSQFEFNGGLILMDSTHMPVGCGTWPAWWENGPNWPTGGEIDILEGYNDVTTNQVSLHTAPGCRMPGDFVNHQSGDLHTSPNFDGFNCASYETANQGCGVFDTDTGSYGDGFNAQGGGVYALVWDKNGIVAYFHPRSRIPDDIKAERPNPANWGTPVARFPSTQCDSFKYFYNHISIFDTTLCGDWAGADGVWNSPARGQSQSCAAKTGYSSCLDYVHNEGHAFQNAYWSVSYVKYFQTSEMNNH